MEIIILYQKQRIVSSRSRRDEEATNSSKLNKRRYVKIILFTNDRNQVKLANDPNNNILRVNKRNIINLLQGNQLKTFYNLKCILYNLI